jgi:hypothetical protein
MIKHLKQLVKGKVVQSAHWQSYNPWFWYVYFALKVAAVLSIQCWFIAAAYLVFSGQCLRHKCP